MFLLFFLFLRLDSESRLLSRESILECGKWPQGSWQPETRWVLTFPILLCPFLSAVFLEGVRHCLPSSGRSDPSYLELSIKVLCLIHDKNIFQIVNYDYHAVNMKIQDIQAYVPRNCQGWIRDVYEGHPSPCVYICTLGHGSQKPALGAILEESSVLFFWERGLLIKPRWPSELQGSSLHLSALRFQHLAFCMGAGDQPQVFIFSRIHFINSHLPSL